MSCFKLLFAFVLISCFSTVMAQRRSHAALTYGGGGNGGTNFNDGWAIGFGTAYDVPQGNLSYSYKPTINFNTSVYRYFGAITTSASLGYHSYKPKEDAFYEYNDDGSLSYTSTLSNFRVFSFYLGAAYNIDVADNFRVYGGVNIGAYYTHYAISYDVTGYESGSSTLSQQEAYLAPKLGIIFPLSSSVGISMESKYNFFSPTGNSNQDASVGTVFRSFSAGAELVIKF